MMLVVVHWADCGNSWVVGVATGTMAVSFVTEDSVVGGDVKMQIVQVVSPVLLLIRYAV